MAFMAKPPNMYRHNISSFGDYSLHELADEAAGNRLAIVPGFGACILALQLKGQSILDGYQAPTEMAINRWGKNTLLFPFPNRLKAGHYQWGGREYQFPVNDFQTGNALHGFGPANQAMEVSEVDIQPGQARIRCTFRYDGHFSHYPFPFVFSFGLLLTNPGEVDITFSVLNEGRSAMPFGMGWHPYFQLSDTVDELSLELPPCEMVGIGPAMTPTGKRYEYTTFTQLRRLGAEVLDNCFVLQQQSGRARITLMGSKGRMQYWQEAGPERFGFLQLFTPPHRRSLAIEPMSCNIDAFNNGEGLLRLESGQEATARFGFVFEAKK